MEYTYMKFKLDEDDDGVCCLPVYVGLSRSGCAQATKHNASTSGNYPIQITPRYCGSRSSPRVRILNFHLRHSAEMSCCFVSIVSMCRVIVDDGVDHD